MKATDYSALAGPLEQAAREEMAAWGIGSLAVALVAGQETVYAAGFGEARRDSVFRCGSISKLFNAFAVMQLVEAGKLDLDAPLDRYVDGLLPVNPFSDAAPMTLRQLLCHRSGIAREAPVGSYFDPSQPSLLRTVSSIAQTVLVNPPNTKTRYSNIGPSIAGHIVERVAGTGFGQYQSDHILGPLGMTDSSWSLEAAPREKLITASMRVADGKGGFGRRPAPVFNIGEVPAGNLFSTAEDLARFLAMLAAGGQGPGGRILGAESLAQMLMPQLTTEPEGYGLGFVVGRLLGHKSVSHNGAVYGHSASLVLLPEARLGAVVLGNEDLVNGRTRRLANLALSLMLAAGRAEEPPPLAPPPLKLSPGVLAAFCGDYESQSFWAELRIENGRLAANISGQPTRLTPLRQSRFLAENRVTDAVPVDFEGDSSGRVTGFVMGGQKFMRRPASRPDIPGAWRSYLGSFGPPFIPLVVSARHGRLYAMTENAADYHLTPLNRRVFAFPPGLYADEHLVFLAEGDDQTRRVEAANMVLAGLSA
ncbi:MAG TPA: serine hydrolase domain-containing protein [Dongiaceae bacterium]|nr:serine hydrolase domain-containing protein [Dongiaceae bacterium]